MDTFLSLIYICYGFSCLIKYECIDNKLITMKNNPDVCENQFANDRQNCFSYGSPTETEAMDSMLKSIFIIMESIQK